MSRSYTKVRPKAHHVYLVEGVMELFAVSRNTVSNWVRQGLRPSDEAQPYVFRGAELIRFHKIRQARRTGLARGFFHCMRCKEAVVPQLPELSIAEERPKVFRARARCPDCDAALSKLLGETECTMFRNCLATNTSLESIVEEIVVDPAGIGKYRPDPDEEISHNDRLLLQWLGHAGRYDPKTVTAHLASIRAFEAFVAGKPFAMLTVQDAENWRSTMIATEGGGLSRGTLRHRASHLRLFFSWLGKQTGYRNLAPLEACFDLPRRFQAKTIPQPRAWPEMDEAVEMLKAMPTDALIDQRARAIFAFAFLTGFRADARGNGGADRADHHRLYAAGNARCDLAPDRPRCNRPPAPPRPDRARSAQPGPRRALYAAELGHIRRDRGKLGVLNMRPQLGSLRQFRELASGADFFESTVHNACPSNHHRLKLL